MININYLPYNRLRHSPITFKYIKMIKEEHRNKININILTSNINYWNTHVKELKECGISSKIINFRTGENYIEKIKYAINENVEYSIKLDEDCFVNNYVWDYMIENIHILDNKENLTMAPLLSIGIPTTDRFVECFFSEEEKNELFEIYKKENLPYIWNFDYSILNNSLRNWNSKDFYETVSKLQYYYKGIHPIRFSREGEFYFLKMVLLKEKLFKAKGDYSLITLDAPYFCNSFFAIKTNVWKFIINDRSLYVDRYDEVPLNRYRERNNLKFLYIDNSFGIHTTYGCVYGGSEEIEVGFVNYGMED